MISTHSGGSSAAAAAGSANTNAAVPAAATPTAATPLLEAQREYLQFEEVSTKGLPAESAALLGHIQQVAEQVLYHWKTFPIVLPPPLAVQGDNTYGLRSKASECSTAGAAIVLRDVFIPPSFDELDAVAADSKGDPKHLQPSHLSSIRENGEFQVPSLHFPQQEHVWQLSQWLQKGRKNTWDTLLEDAAAAAAIITVVAKQRITGSCFSLWHCLKSVWTGILMIIDLLLGVPWLSAEHLTARLQEERCTHLVQELSSKSGDTGAVCEWLVEQVRRISVEKVPLNTSSSQQPPLPYVFLTPQGQQLDLTLFNRDVMRAAVPVLVSILEKEARGWFLHFREKAIADLRAQGLTDAQVEKAACRAVQEEYLRRVCSSISSHPSLQQLAGPGTAQLLCQHAAAVTLMHRAVSEVEEVYRSSTEEFECSLRATHPILSRVRRWREQKLREKHRQLEDEHKWRPHMQALAACKEAGLHQHAYFLQRDLAFMRERAPVLQKELQSLKLPNREFEWRAQILMPERYVVRRTFQGTSEIIPTVLSSVPTSITASRTPHQPGYVLHKQVVCVTSTRWPLWRLFNLCHRSWAWTCNAVYLFGLWIPLCSPISLRALCCKHPFMPDYELSQVNGAVCPSRASLTPTLHHRLHHLWRKIAKARTHFETTPDTGFIGKGVSRHLNRVYNYVIKGVFGTLFYTLLFPLVCVVVSLASFAVALLAPLWVPCVVVLGSVLSPLAYDFDAPLPGRRWFPLPRAVLVHIFLGGLVQPVLLVLVLLLLCPVLATVVMAFGILRYSVRCVWDWLLFETIIRKRGRVPAANSCLVKRIAGPGLHHHYCYQISSEQALAAFECRLEQDMLLAHQRILEEQMARPLATYNEFLRVLFGPFSGGVAQAGGGHERVTREVKELHRTLQDKVDLRRRDLQLGLHFDIRTRLKLTTRELKATLKQATILLEQFYPSRMFPMILAPLTAHQLSSEQQSRIDSGISTGGDLEDDGVSRASLVGSGVAPRTAANSRELLQVAGDTTQDLPTQGGSYSLAGHGKNLAGGANHKRSVLADASNSSSQFPKNDAVASSQRDPTYFESQNLARRRTSQDSGNFARNSSEGTGLDSEKGALDRGVRSFDCERGLLDDALQKKKGPKNRPRDASEDRLLDDECQEVLLGKGHGSVAIELSLGGAVIDRVEEMPASESQLHLVNTSAAASPQGSVVTTTAAGLVGAADTRNYNNKRENKFSSEEAWWDSRGLQPGDYASLAAILFTEIFSADFLTPMDDEDTAFQIEASGVNLSRYTRMLQSCPNRPDLDPLLTVHAPRGNSIHVPAPYLDMTCFTPLVRHATPTVQRPVCSRGSAASKAAMWGTSIAQRLSLRARPNNSAAAAAAAAAGARQKRKVKDRTGGYDSTLIIPPPIPHPAVIAVIIYNREASEPIQLSSPNTQQVLRCMEDSVNLEECSRRRRRNREWSAGTSLDNSSGDSPDSSPPSSPPSLYDDGAGITYSHGDGAADSRTATLPLSATLNVSPPAGAALFNRSIALDLNSAVRHGTGGGGGGYPAVPSSLGEEEEDSLRGVLDANPLRSLLESHPPFSVALDLAPPEDPPENDYEDTLRTLHATSSSLESDRSAGYPTAV